MSPTNLKINNQTIKYLVPLDNKVSKNDSYVCMLSLYLYPIYPGHGTRYPLSVLESLIASGHNVDVITVAEKTLKIGRRQSLSFFTLEKYKGSSIFRIKVPQVAHTTMANRLVVYSFFIFFSTLLAVLRPSRRYKAIFGLSPYPIPLLSIPGKLISKVKNSKFIPVMGDLWPDALLDLEIVKGKYTKKLVIIIHKIAFNFSEYLLVLTPAIKKGLAKWQVSGNKVSVVEMGVDTTLFKPLQKNKEILVQNNIDNKFVVMYSGIFGPAYDFDTLLQTAKQLQHNRDIVFIIRGDGERKQEIINKLKFLKLENTRLLPSITNMNDVIDFLNVADIFVVPMMSVGVSSTAHPSKIFEFLSVGKPVISNAQGALSTIISQHNCGMIVEPGPEHLSDAIMEFYGNPQKKMEYGKNGRNLIINNFSYPKIGKHLSDVIKNWNTNANVRKK